MSVHRVIDYHLRRIVFVGTYHLEHYGTDKILSHPKRTW